MLRLDSIGRCRDCRSCRLRIVAVDGFRPLASAALLADPATPPTNPTVNADAPRTLTRYRDTSATIGVPGVQHKYRIRRVHHRAAPPRASALTRRRCRLTIGSRLMGLSSKRNASRMPAQSEWPFLDPENTAVFSTVGVVKRHEPVCLVCMIMMAHGSSWVADSLRWLTQ